MYVFGIRRRHQPSDDAHSGDISSNIRIRFRENVSAEIVHIQSCMWKTSKHIESGVLHACVCVCSYKIYLHGNDIFKIILEN